MMILCGPNKAIGHILPRFQRIRNSRGENTARSRLRSNESSVMRRKGWEFHRLNVGIFSFLDVNNVERAIGMDTIGMKILLLLIK